MRKSAVDRQKELIASLVDARQAVLGAISALPFEARDTACIGVWCVRDLLAHMVGWDFTNLQAIQEILAGQYPGFFQHYDKDWHSYNAQLVAAYRCESFEALLAQVADSHRKFITFLESLPARTLLDGKVRSARGRTVTIHNLLESEIYDENTHAGQVRAFLEQVSSSRTV